MSHVWSIMAMKEANESQPLPMIMLNIIPSHQSRYFGLL